MKAKMVSIWMEFLLHMFCHDYNIYIYR